MRRADFRKRQPFQLVQFRTSLSENFTNLVLGKKNLIGLRCGHVKRTRKKTWQDCEKHSQQKMRRKYPNFSVCVVVSTLCEQILVLDFMRHQQFMFNPGTTFRCVQYSVCESACAAAAVDERFSCLVCRRLHSTGHLFSRSCYCRQIVFRLCNLGTVLELNTAAKNAKTKIWKRFKDARTKDRDAIFFS